MNNSKSLEKQSTKGNKEFWATLAIHTKRGFFDDMETFQGLFKVVDVQNQRKKDQKTNDRLGFDT